MKENIVIVFLNSYKPLEKITFSVSSINNQSLFLNNIAKKIVSKLLYRYNRCATMIINLFSLLDKDEYAYASHLSSLDSCLL
jgi:hypothetical protein